MWSTSFCKACNLTEICREFFSRFIVIKWQRKARNCCPKLKASISANCERWQRHGEYILWVFCDTLYFATLLFISFVFLCVCFCLFVLVWCFLITPRARHNISLEHRVSMTKLHWHWQHELAEKLEILEHFWNIQETTVYDENTVRKLHKNLQRRRM